MTDPVGAILTEFGRQYGMTGADVAAHLLLGDRRHEDAPADVCGMVSPRDESSWCVQRAGHPGDHNGYAPRDGCTAWADHCSRCAEHPPCGCKT